MKASIESGDWRDQLAARHRSWLVTGAAGFIGSHLVQHLLAAGQKVVGLDNFTTGRASNLSAIRDAVGNTAWSHFSLVEGDIRDRATVATAMREAEYVLHQAALGSVPRSIRRPWDTHSVNVDGTIALFLEAIEREGRKVVYASSSSVYGDSETLPKTEESIGRALSPYAASKQVVEIYARTFAATHGLPAVGLRYFNVVGTRQDPNGPYAAAIPRWVDLLLDGRPPVVFGDGATTRDFSPVVDVVQANVIAALSDSDTNGDVFNVALGKETSLNQVIEILELAVRERVGPGFRHIAPTYEDFRPGDIRYSLADISKARERLGFLPQGQVATVLAEIVAEASGSREG